MGLFLTADGHYQGWLAAFLCCCAALSDDEHPIEKDRSRRKAFQSWSCYVVLTGTAATTRTGVCDEQPAPISPSSTSPAVAHRQTFNVDKPMAGFDSSRTGIGPAELPPSIQPLDLGHSLIHDRRPNRGRRKSSFGRGSRPSISAPNSFRRIEYTDGQRASLVPLRLGPVVLSESPPQRNSPMTVGDTIATRNRNRSDSTQHLLSDARRESYRAQRDTPYERCQRPSSTTMVTSSDSCALGNARVEPSVARDQSPTTAALTTRTSSSSLRRQALEASATSASQRSSNEHSRLKRKRSLQSMRKPYAESGELDVDKEILELNTIVEERRVDAARSRTPDHHVPAVAPTLQLRARSETLNDIGSIFARPVTARQPARLHIFDSPEKPTRPFMSRATSCTSSRVSGWLSGILPTASTPAQSQEPFYKCVPHGRTRAHSDASLCTSLMDLDSPSLTAASSPTSKSHSRSLTAESRLTPLSPESMLYSHELPDLRKGPEQHWPIVTPSQVGLAI